MAVRLLLIAIFSLCLSVSSYCQVTNGNTIPKYQEHIVRDRETPSSIAAEFNIRLKDFLLINNFPDGVKLNPGQKVLIRQLKDGEMPEKEKPYYASKSAEKDDEMKEDRPAPKKTVKSATPGASVNEEKSMAAKPAPAAKETTSASKDKPGDVITGPDGTKYAISGDGYHIVEKGQSFYRIALIYHLSVDELKKLNNMTSTDIKVGQKLKVAK